MQLTENYDSYIAASGDEPGAAIFMSVFFIKIGFVPIGAEQDVRHPVRRSAHLLANHTQVNVRTTFDIAEGKGVHREVESEGSRMWEQTNHGQISGLTDRNHI